MIWLAIPVTLAVYAAAIRLNRAVRSPLTNPVLVTMAVLVTAFLAFGIDYEPYRQGTRPMTWLLEPAVVALAVPMYRHLAALKKRFVPIVVSLAVGVLTSLVVGAEVARFAGGTDRVVESLAPKAVTTPVAMAISAATGGIPSLTAASVILAGILGATLGFGVLWLFGVRDDESVGVAMGAASHALGTARCAEHGAERGAFSSMALVICAVLTAVIAPWVVPLLIGGGHLG